MNTIVYAGMDCDEKFYSNKYLKIFCGADDTVCAVYGGTGEIKDRPCAVLERAAVPYGAVLNFTEPESGFVRAAVEQAAHYFNCQDPKKDIALRALGELLCAYVNLAQSSAKRFSPVVASVRESADKNLTDSAYSLEDFLKKLPLNYDYVRKLFKKETGETPHAYLLRRRMELAANLLSGAFANKYSNYSVSQVAEACGFSDPLYFSRVFKKYFGMSPSGYTSK